MLPPKIIIGKSPVSTNADGLISLTDLWKAAGSDPRKRVKDWFDSKPIRMMTARLGREGVNPVWTYQFVDGFMADVFVCLQVAMAYADYLGLSDDDKPKPATPTLPSKFVIGDKPVATNGDGLVSLTDLWRAAGRPAEQKVVYWLRRPEVADFVISVVGRVVEIHPTISRPTSFRGDMRALRAYAKKVRDEAASAGVIKSVPHNTYAHPQIALAYAKYLSPELHMAVNEVFMRYKAGDPTLAEEVIDKVRRTLIAFFCYKTMQLETLIDFSF